MQLKQIDKNDYCAILGNWDPPLKEYEDFFLEFIKYCSAHKLTPLIIVITPNPSIYYAEKYYRDYFDFETRVEWIKSIGITHFIEMTFEKSDLKSGAIDFFNNLDKITTLKEFWVGGLQSFGSDSAGSIKIVESECEKRSIKLTNMEKTLLIKKSRAKVYNKFVTNQFEESKDLTGYYPTYNIMSLRDKNIFDGDYIAENIEFPFVTSSAKTVNITIKAGNIVSESQLSYDWLRLIRKENGCQQGI